MSGFSFFTKSKKPFFMHARIPFTFQDISFIVWVRLYGLLNFCS
jgi:hypothetical protein